MSRWIWIVITAAVALLGQQAEASMPISSPWMENDTFKTAHGCGGSYYHEDMHGEVAGTQASEYAIDFNYEVCTHDLGYPLVAVADGIVVQADWNSGGFGYILKIDHGNYQGKSVLSLMAHCQDGYPFAVVLGEEVRQGQVVGYIGGTPGYSPHLHFELREDGQSVPVSSMDGYNFCEGSECWSNEQTSANGVIIDDEFVANGGSTAFGTLQSDTHWYHSYSAGDLYRTGRAPNNCYVQNWGGGNYGNCGIVYDALGGARRAYTVRTGFWQNGQDPPNGWANQGGPTSSLGMPISNEYETDPGYVARQDFMLGWLNYVSGSPSVVAVHTWNVCAPGWTASGWNPQVSYRVADIFTDNGGFNHYGEPTDVVKHNSNGWYQTFQYNGPIVVPDAYDVGGQGGPELADASPPDYVVSVLRPCVSNVTEQYSNRLAAKLVDGSSTSFAYPGANNVDYEITLDGLDFVVDATITFGYFGESTTYITSWQLQVLTPAGTWETVDSGGCPYATSKVATVNRATTKLRVKAWGNNWIGLYELTANGFHNVARGQPVTLVSAGSSTNRANLTDGDLATKASSGETSFTYEVPLIETMGVGYVALVGKEHTTGGGSPITAWSIQGNDGDSWITFASGTNPNTPSVVATTMKEMEGIRVTCSGTGTPGLYEVGVYGALTEPGSLYDVYSHTAITGRFTSDAKSDICYYRRASGGWTVGVSDGAEFDDGGAWSINFGTDEGTLNWQPLVGDFNGDGKEDIAIFTPLAGNWQVATSDGTEFENAGTWRNGWGVDDGTMNWRGLAGDFTGDGKTDICIYGPRTGNWQVSVSDGAEFDGDGTWINAWAVENGAHHWQPLVGDFNGDGKDDICAYSPIDGTWAVAVSDGGEFDYAGHWADSWAVNSGSTTWVAFTGDFTGDGKDDVCAYAAATGAWRVGVSDGAEFDDGGYWRTSWATETGSDHWQPIAGDFTGDGKDDVCAYSLTTGSWQVSVSDGAEFDGDGTWASSFGYGGSMLRALPSVLEPFVLFQNRPNPFNAATVIAYTLPRETRVHVGVYNVLGQLVDVLVNAQQPAGDYHLNWDASRAASGVYFYRITTGENIAQRKMVLLR